MKVNDEYYLLKRLLVISLLGLISSLLSLKFQADDWPQFRGPQGWGVSETTGLLAQFGPQQNVLWKVSLPQGHSSPVLIGQKLLLTGAEDRKLITLCLDRVSGEILWRREAPRDRAEKFVQGFNTPASPTPVTDGESVYVFFGDLGLICYDLGGKERWRLPLGPFNNINGHGSSPVLVDDKVILLCDQDTNAFLLAVDTKTGKQLWKAERPEVTRGYATPGVFRPKAGPAELIVPGAYELISYSADNGEKLWWVKGLSWQSKSVPLIDGEVIYVNSWETEGDHAQPKPDSIPTFQELLTEHDKNQDGKISREELGTNDEDWEDLDLDKDNVLSARDWEYHRARVLSRNNLLAIRHGGRGDLTDTNVLWRHSKSLPNVPSPLLYRGVLYLVRDGGIATSLDPVTGKVLKQERLKGALEQYYASPVAGDGKVFMLSQAGKLSVLKAGPNWEVLALNDMEEECFATPAIADGRIYVRTLTTLYCFGK
jgi:outer membrane protein assembly factor BamB